MTSGTLPTAPPLGMLDEVLSGRLGVAAVRDVVLHPWQHGAGGSPAEIPAGPLTDGAVGLTLLRSKFKPGRKLSAYYRRGPGDSAAAEYLAVSWHSGAADGDTGAVTVQAFPDDPGMPQLARLSDPDYLASLATDLDPGLREAAVPLVDGPLQVTPVRYRPGQRHVLSVIASLATPGPRSGFFAKTDKDTSGERATEVATRLGPLLARRCPHATVVEPMGFSARDSAALWRMAPGAPLSRLLADRAGEAAAYVALVGRAARVLHDEACAAMGPSIVDRLPDHDLASEVRSTLRAGEHVRALLPEVGRQFDDVAAGVVRALEGVEGHAACFLHGDLKSDNLLVDDGRVRVLDLDRVCLGDAALDLGKFLADLRWCAGSEPRAQRLQAALRDGYGPAADDRWARAGLLTALFALKFAARRCAVHDPEWESRVRAQVDLAQSTLSAAARPW